MWLPEYVLHAQIWIMAVKIKKKKVLVVMNVSIGHTEPKNIFLSLHLTSFMDDS